MNLFPLAVCCTVMAAGFDFRSESLQPREFEPILLHEITPHSWSLTQLRIQANGLSGVLDKFWPQVSESVWINHKYPMSAGGERAIYWCERVRVRVRTLLARRINSNMRKPTKPYLLSSCTDNHQIPPCRSDHIHKQTHIHTRIHTQPQMHKHIKQTSSIPGLTGSSLCTTCSPMRTPPLPRQHAPARACLGT